MESMSRFVEAFVGFRRLECVHSRNLGLITTHERRPSKIKPHNHILYLVSSFFSTI